MLRPVSRSLRRARAPRELDRDSPTTPDQAPPRHRIEGVPWSQGASSRGWLLIPCGFDDVEDHVDDQFWV